MKLWAEFLILFFGLVGGYALIGSPGSPIPLLVLLGLGAFLYLRRRPDFDNATFTRRDTMAGSLKLILVRWAIAAALLLAAVALLRPEHLFDLPRNDPLIWVFVAVFYPLLSVYPQELIFRAFLMHRYAPIFNSDHKAAAASAAAFGFAHIIYGSVVAVALTVIAGWIFARTYQKSRSLLVTAIEHSLYGVLVFTIGLGDIFYHGTISR